MSGAMDRSNRRARWVVLAGTLAAHALYAALGIRFNASTLGSYMQFVDPELLRTDLWRSIHYLRDQPPLFNLVVGLVLKACGRFWGEARSPRSRSAGVRRCCTGW